jgi:excisionase family DNA binding protein
MMQATKPNSAARQPIPLAERLALSVPEAAALLGVSRAKLYREFLAGRLHKSKAGGRTLVAMTDAKAWLDSCGAA